MRKSIVVIGEGITEKYYIESLRGLSDFQIKPRSLNKKASNLKALEKEILDAANMGADEIYCLIDMDGKTEGKNKEEYLKLKNKYHNQIYEKKKQGVKAFILFIESERCTELWFLYHFIKSATTKKYNSYQELENELQKYRPNYEKTDKYFRSVGSIHDELTKENAEHKGSLELAIKNAKITYESHISDDRNYTYTEIYKLIEALNIE